MTRKPALTWWDAMNLKQTKAGNPESSRRLLGSTSHSIAHGRSLPPEVADWLSVALSSIADGEDANKALGLKRGRGRPRKNLWFSRIGEAGFLMALGFSIDDAKEILAKKHNQSVDAIKNQLSTPNRDFEITPRMMADAIIEGYQAFREGRPTKPLSEADKNFLEELRGSLESNVEPEAGKRKK
ncbi:MAG: hypothetical protein ABFS45_17115 [Pseudomonadota bacterium]